MKFTNVTPFAVAALATATAATKVLESRATATLTPVTITGNAFYNGTDRFYIRGVAYQPGGSSASSDPIADAAGCSRDLPYFQQLGINTIRVYSVDNTANHDDCMNALAAAGIYLILDTDNSLYSLNRDDPSESYNSVYLQSVFATIDAFQGYSNTMAFLSGNEVINSDNTTDCAPYVKSVTRDMKQYIGSRGYRAIPVGYSAADISSSAIDQQQVLGNYMNCGTDDQRSDFYSINDYSWCDPSSFTQSGWDQLVANYTNYGIPLFMSEYGCITNTRTFQEVSALYNTEMTNVFSGGLVYEYSEEGNGFGLVTISGSTVTTGDGFGYLQTAFANATNPTGNGGASSTSSATTCPPSQAGWDVANDDLPAIPSAAADYMSTGAGPGPGLTGDGSQNAGNSSTESTGTASAGSGTVTSTAKVSGTSSTTTATKGAAASMRPIVDFSSWWTVAVVFASTIFGMLLL